MKNISKNTIKMKFSFQKGKIENTHNKNLLFFFSLLFCCVEYSFFYCSYEANCLRALYKLVSL